MAYTGLATINYKDPLTTIWMNSVKENFDDMAENRCFKAWINFNGSGAVSAHASFNIASVTYNALARYTFIFTSSLTNTYYGFWGMGRNTGVNHTVFSYCESGWANSVTTGHVDTEWNDHDGGQRNASRGTFCVMGGKGGPGL